MDYSVGLVGPIGLASATPLDWYWLVWQSLHWYHRPYKRILDGSLTTSPQTSETDTFAIEIPLSRN